MAVALSTAALLFGAPLHARAADRPYYCQTEVFGYTDCADYGTCNSGYCYNGFFNVNHAYVPGAHYGGVCEHTYIYGTGYTVSRRCSNTDFATSDYGCSGDLWNYYNAGYILSGHAGNNQYLGQYIVGHAYIEKEGTCVFV